MGKNHHGEQTGEFGEWLAEYLKSSDHYQDLIVFFDHGNSNKCPNVAAVKGFYGDHVANRNRLADIDVMVANDDHEILFLIEIEESEMSPKKILGDVFSILFCNRVAVGIGVQNKYFAIRPETQLIVSGIVPCRGHKREKLKDVIMPRLKRFEVPRDAIDVEKVDCVYGKDILEMMCSLKDKMRAAFPEETL